MKLENRADALKKKFGRNGAFIEQCMSTEALLSEHGPLYDSLWAEASTVEGFIDSVRDCDALMIESQAYGELARVLGWRIPIDSEQLIADGTYSCEGGSVRIGDAAGRFAVSIPNGCGDGEFDWVAIADGAFNRNAADFAASIEGEPVIYATDFDELGSAEGVKLPEGRYFVYVAKGMIIFAAQ